MPQRPFHSPGAGLEYRLLMALIMASAALVTVLLIQLLLPWLVVAALGAGAVWFWRRQRARDRVLHQVFYAQVAAHQGRISVLDFAIAAQITGREARRFLDQRAQDFWGDFEPTAAGDVLYTFRSPGTLAAETAIPQVISLTAADLARRLGCTTAELTQPAVALNLLAWSRDRDPDGCGWRYDAAGDRYWPVSEE
ncbi:hypothetical protein PGN35_007185 [Nodosilinea sp. PGN35]|uniref:hypothetical protein n=1 Tax=Nodosilinea sp. PGN35 TaxID=3020489 RepID=UPI0023B310FC|nr:hypothetical protein [Nodosilinea sp. TSF1-S3]MDF0367055.1 hypothetical protein [Nodosilinea sp. TSF1-S3]